MILVSELESILRSQGAALVGFADLRDITSEVRHNLPNGISIGVALNPSVIAKIDNGPTKEYHAEYERANEALYSMGTYAAEFLRGHGSRAHLIAPTSYAINPKTYSTPLPHKTTATRAGLGWIGSCLSLDKAIRPEHLYINNYAH